ncbi:MAG: CAP family protein [Proteobacteria bacterium]|nr:CAP family protein [Pseudomonadota bacterium]MBU1140800.1 CAP family protein [Pseudomonadota bacterium]MBU1231377.1 CAP family protein [Pseudomonadota bacterium]MBU1418600.1 CAP family protein [Pseudomonadota bacterium]MBU1454190.1 CAP family protein [Pseudomonadota bacterium]
MTQSESEEWLASHNRYRSLHKSKPLQWSDTLAESARAYAATCPRGHSSSEYGENIAWATYVQIPENVVARWYSEEPEYDYENPRFSSGIGHFAQIVWKATAEVGCACRSDCPGGYSDVCVCQYNPPGNYRNRYAENVLPPQKK